jgi:hypothetical protein
MSLSSAPRADELLGAVPVPIRLTNRDQCTRNFSLGGAVPTGDSMRAFFRMPRSVDCFGLGVETGTGNDPRSTYAMSMTWGDRGCRSGVSGALVREAMSSSSSPSSSNSFGECGDTPGEGALGEETSGGEAWLLERRQFQSELMVHERLCRQDTTVEQSAGSHRGRCQSVFALHAETAGNKTSPDVMLVRPV